MFLWLATAHQLIYYSYVGEGFNFLGPVIGWYLFSVKKGVWFWHPAYLIAVLALVRELAVRSLEAAVVLSIVAANIYIGASWTDPSFGESFGCRQIIEMIPLLALPMASTLSALRATNWRWVAGFIAALLICINLLQFYGYISGGIPRNNTTWRQYRAFWTEWLCRDCVMIAFGAPGLPAGHVLDFSKSGDSHVYLLAGWSQPEDWGTWSDGSRASLAFRQTGLSGPVRLRLLASGFEPADGQVQTVTVSIDGHEIGIIRLSSDLQWVELDVPKSALADREDHRLEFDIGAPASPADRGMNSDPRRLGIAVHKLTLIGDATP